MKKIKICVAASEGGHLTEIAQLDEIFKQHDSFFVTEKTVLTEPLAQRKKVYFLKHINRRKFFFPLLFIVNTFTSLMILYRERPQLTVSTGALSVVPICIFSKIFGVKLIFIETYSRISSYTLTGKLLYYFSDLFIIQRPELKRFYPKSKVAGSIF